MCSSDEADRKFAVEKILELSQLGVVIVAETVTCSKINQQQSQHIEGVDYLGGQ